MIVETQRRTSNLERFVRIHNVHRDETMKLKETKVEEVRLTHETNRGSTTTLNSNLTNLVTHAHGSDLT
jgi:hypothetical protein